MLEGVLIFATLASVGCVLLFFVLWPYSRLESEKEARPLHEEQCLGFQRFGISILTGPALGLRLSMYDEFLVIGTSFGKLALPYDQVGSAGRKNFLVMRPLSLNTRAPVRHFFLFPRDPDSIIGILKRKGVRIEESHG